MNGNRISLARKTGDAVLRKLKQPLYDTTVIEGGAATQQLQFFNIPIGGAMPVAGGAKSLADTNMSQAAQLGTPQEFSLVGFNYEFFVLEPDDIANGAPDYLLMYEQSTFTFVFSNNRPWLRVPLSQIPQGISATGTGASGDITNNIEFGYLHQGLASVKEYYNFMLPNKKLIHIYPNEPFGVDIDWFNGAITLNTANDQRCRVFIVGFLYSAL